MSRSNTRYSIYPAPKAIRFLGSTAPGLNQAIECWAALLARATADNGRIFDCYRADDHGGVIKSLHDWGVLAEVIKDTAIEPDFPSPAEMIASTVEDAYRLETIRGAWLFSDDESDSPDHLSPGWKHSDDAIQELIEKLRKLDYSHAWAAIVAVKWYWDRHTQINCELDEWWTLAFRRQWGEKEAKVPSKPKRK